MKRSGPLRRTALKRTGRKFEREQADLAAFRAAIRGRLWCQAGGLHDEDDEPVCGTLHRHPGVHCHHRWPEDRDRGVHDPARGLYLCARSHTWVHDHPRDAGLLGLLR